jgi:ABC-type transporter Mla maintaining outer membrane lipid asymmetry ATPase subunit MlaF
MQASKEPSLSSGIIEMRDVTIASMQSSETPLVHDVNWNVSAGDFWVIGGLAGSGKSDFLATTAGLTRPREGYFGLFGRDIQQLDEAELLRERLRIGLVFSEGGRLFNYLTVIQNVALPWAYHHNSSPREGEEQAAAILELLELSRMAHETPGRLRRNWRQRVGLARALILRPEVLLLDNPLAGVDPPQIRWWLTFLAELANGHSLMNNQKVTLILATEDLGPWRSQGRQFALIKQKRWLVLGGQTELANSDEPMLRGLLEASVEGA